VLIAGATKSVVPALQPGLEAASGVRPVVVDHTADGLVNASKAATRGDYHPNAIVGLIGRALAAHSPGHCFSTLCEPNRF
jgi:hypothetical protein